MSQGREIFSLEKIFLTKSPPRHKLELTKLFGGSTSKDSGDNFLFVILLILYY